jgi:GT2 family glycosyltransferase
LDDDNVPQENALKNLLIARDLVKTKESEEVVLYSYRGNTRPLDCRAITQGYIKGYKINNFMGLNLLSELKNKFLKNNLDSNINYPIIRTNVGPYGGMFFSSHTLKLIGLPNRDFYLYADDHEYSLRFGAQGVSQYLVYASVLVDIDFYFSGGNFYFSKSDSDFKIYYMVRNHVYLSQRFKKSWFKYNLNKLYFYSGIYKGFIVNILSGKGCSLNRLLLINKAIFDGESAVLGKTFLSKEFFKS